MKDNMKFKIGDKLIKCNKVFRIFKIKPIISLDKKDKLIFYKPYFDLKYGKQLTLSIPLSSLSKTGIRLPISKKELGKIFIKLTHLPKKSFIIDTISAKEMINLNDPYKSAGVLKRLYLEKKDKLESFTRSKEEVFNFGIDQLLEEVAFVSGVTLLKAKEKIQKALAKNL